MLRLLPAYSKCISDYICLSGKSLNNLFLFHICLSSALPAFYFLIVAPTPTCCTGNRVLNNHFITDQPMTPVTPVPWKKQWIFDLADCFANGTPLHRQTWATHSCFLACDGELLFQCEDIGRHNALDKAIGYALCRAT
ncbi:MAG: hypothetical protein EGP80_03830 [Blautia wexlerae]|nr:hypothetical protein [Blautia wexlerae]